MVAPLRGGGTTQKKKLFLKLEKKFFSGPLRGRGDVKGGPLRKKNFFGSLKKSFENKA